MLSRQKTYNTFICVVSFIIINCYSFSQEKQLNIGIRANPNFSISYPSKDSQFDKNHFKITNNGKVGFQLGAVISYRFNKIVLDWNTSLCSKGTGILFYPFDTSKQGFSTLRYNTLIFSNKLFVGYQIKNEDKPYYSIFIGPTLGFDFIGMRSMHGKGNLGFSYVSYYIENGPKIDLNFRGMTTGVSMKIRTELKKIGRIDYGVSFDYFFNNFPALEIKAGINGTDYYTNYIPKVHCLSIDLIYYFKKKK